MSRIKGRYVALLEMDFDFEHKPDMFPFQEIKENMTGDMIKNNIRDIILDEVSRFAKNVTVTTQYADLYEVDDEHID